MTPKNRIKAQLDQLQRSRAITYWQLQSGMPGLRWSVSIGGRATIAYSTNEIEAFIVGATAGAKVMTQDKLPKPAAQELASRERFYRIAQHRRSRPVVVEAKELGVAQFAIGIRPAVVRRPADSRLVPHHFLHFQGTSPVLSTERPTANTQTHQ